MYFQQDEKLLKLVQNKTVALVGPSSHLMGTNFGFEIDSYDVVCRINDTSAPSYEADYGHRTDIVFCNFAKNSLPEFEYKFKREICKDIKLTYCPVVKFVGQDNDWPTWKPNTIPQVVVYGQKAVGNVPFSWIGLSNYRYIFDYIGTEPNSGFSSILILLLHEPKELLVAGFSFYTFTDKIDCYYPTYLPRECYTKENWPYDVLKPRLGHDQVIQFNCLKNKIIPTWKELKFDPILERLIQCQS